MRLYIVVGVFLTVVSTVTSQSVPYDCREYDLCQNKGECIVGPEDGATHCQCAGVFTGQKCEATNVTCDTSCENGGTCWQTSAGDSTTNRCACVNGYYGDLCESKFVEINCTKESATYMLSFPSTFGGSFTLVDVNGTELNTTNCPAVGTEDDRKTITAEMDVSVNASAESASCYMKDEQSAYTTFTAYIMVRYDKDFRTSLDDIFELTCNHTMDEFQISSKLTDVEFNSDELNKINTSIPYVPVTLVAIDEADQPLSNNVKLGADIVLFLFLDADSGYASLTFKDCYGNNTLEGDEAKTFKFLENGCPTKRGKLISTKHELASRTVDDKEVAGVIVSISAFKFPNSGDIGVLCTAKLCETDDESCALPTNCDVPAETNGDTNTDDNANGGTDDNANGGTDENTNGGTDDSTGKRRKKRAASNDEQMVSKVFTIGGTEKNDQNKTEEQGQEGESVDSLEKCMARPELTAVVAVLGAVVCVLLIVCFTLACVILRRSGKRVTTYDATTLQPTTDRYQIPRAHVNESYGEF